MQERCSFRLLPNATVQLTTRLAISNARGGRSVSVSVVPGWNVARMYPKAKRTLAFRLGPGRTVRRVMTRTIPRVPGLWAELQAAGRVNCASTFTYRIP